jgi:hypothetical protein
MGNDDTNTIVINFTNKNIKNISKENFRGDFGPNPSPSYKN